MRCKRLLHRAGARGIPLLAALVVPFSMSGQASAATAEAAAAKAAAANRAAAPGGQTVSAASQPAKLNVAGGALPKAVKGEWYSYRFRVLGGGTAFWSQLDSLPDGLTLDPDTGVLSGVPQDAGSQEILVTASRGGVHPAIGSGSAFLTVEKPVITNVAVTVSGAGAPPAVHIWGSGFGSRPAAGLECRTVGLARGASLLDASAPGAGCAALAVTSWSDHEIVATADSPVSSGDRVVIGVNGARWTGQAAPARAATITILAVPRSALRAEDGIPFEVTLPALTSVAPATWTVTAGSLPAGLTLDPATGVIGGVPSGAGADTVTVRATIAGGGSATSRITVNASGSVTVPAKSVASSLYQAMYFQAVNNPKSPAHDLENVLLADVASKVFASDPAASASAVEAGLTALKTAFGSATNSLVPASAGAGLNGFGPNLVPQLTGALGVMSSFAKSASAGIVGPAARAVASQIYGNYLKSSIAAGVGYTHGYAAFDDRGQYNSGDVVGSGFHALVSGPAIASAVSCGQASAACASVMNTLLTPTVNAGLGTTSGVSVTDTAAQLKAADPTLATGISDLGLSFNANGSLTLPAGAYDNALSEAGNLNLTLTLSESTDIQSLIASAGDPANPVNVSNLANQYLANSLPGYDVSLDDSIFLDGIDNEADPQKGKAKGDSLLSGDSITQGATTLLKTLGSNNATQDTEVADTIGGFIALCSEDYAGAIKDLFGILGALGGGGPDEAFTLAQQTDKMIQSVYTNLSADLKQVQGQIAQVQTTLNNMYAAMINGFSDVLFATGQVTGQLVTVELTLGQLQYQVDLTDGDLVAFGQGQIQTQIQTTIDTCLGLAARNLAPLDFSGFSNCEGQFVAELTDASNTVEEYTTAAPPAPSGGDYNSDGTVATTLQAHGLDPAAELSYVLSILNGWYGLGSNPASLPVALVNPGVWSEVALAYRELLDEYPQYSAGTEPDLAQVEQPGEQVAQLISALQQDNTSSWTNPAIENIAGNYSGTLAQVVNDVNARENGFPSISTTEYLTPAGGPWDGYNPFNGPEQATPSNTEVRQPAAITSMPVCGSGASPLSVSDSPAWQTSVKIPNSWYLLFNLVGYANSAIKGTTMPLCYNFSSTKPVLVCHLVKNIPVCDYEATMSGSLSVQFAGTDWATHTMETIATPTEANYTCTTTACFTAANYFAGLITKDGSLAALLADSGGKTVTPDTSLLDSEGNQILAAEQKQAYLWAADAFNGSDAALTADMANLTGAFELLQLTAQILTPSASLGNQAISDILYGQDQLPTTAAGPNNPVAALGALAGGSGANPLGQWYNVQSGRLSLVENLLDGYLGSAQEGAATSAAAASAAMAPSTAGSPPAGDLATAEAPDLTYSTLAQLATGAVLDTDTVTVKNPGGQIGVVTRAASLHMSAASSANAPITNWSAAGLPPGLSINKASGLISGAPTTTGSYHVTVTATDTVGSSEHNTGHATFTWTVSKLVACGSQLVSNGGFESGLAPWRSSAGVRIAGAKALPAYAGKWLARLGGRTSPRTDYLSQSVTIQASCATSTLSFDQRIVTNDPATKAYDTLAVQILTPGGKVLRTLASYSNRNASGKYRLYQFSLKSFIGTTIVIRFASAETLTKHTTSFLIDNVTLKAS